MVVIDDVIYRAEHIALDLADRIIEHRRTLGTASPVDRKMLSLFEAHLVISEDRVGSLLLIKGTYDRIRPPRLRLIHS